LFFLLRAKIGRYLGSAFVLRPLGRGGAPKHVFLVQLCAAFDEEANKLRIAEPGGVVQWGAVRVSADGVIAIWIFARVEQQAGTFDAPILDRQGEREMALAAVGGWQQAANLLKAAKGDRDGKRDAAAALNQGGDRFKPAMKSRRFDGAVGVRPVIA
jgi:hypothetical protein